MSTPGDVAAAARPPRSAARRRSRVRPGRLAGGALALVASATIGVIGAAPASAGQAAGGLRGRPGARAVQGAAAGPASAGASAGGTLTLVHQSSWVTSPSAGVPGTFSLTVGLARSLAARGGLALDVTVFNRLTARSSLEQDFTSPPTGVLDTTGALSVGSALGGAAGVTGQQSESVAVATDPDETAPAGQGIVDLDCAPGTCSGVYPVEVELEHDGSRLSRFTTFLTYVEQASPTPLEVSVVLPVAGDVQFDDVAGAPARSAVPHLARSAVGPLDTLVATLAAHPQLPVTLDVDPRTVAALALAGRGGAEAVHQLAVLSQQPVDQFPAQTYAPVNVAGLVGAGLTGELRAQRRAGQSLLAEAHIRTRAGTLVSYDRPGSDLSAGLRALGARRVVVPAAGLAQATEEIYGDTVTWSEPFRLDLGTGSAMAAGVADGGLGALFAADPGDPVLAANQLLADLAFIHFEVPGAKARGVVVAAPETWAPDAAMVGALESGLTANPVLTAGTLDHFFSAVPAGTHGSPRVRHPAGGGPGARLAAGLGARLASARGHLDAFAAAQRGAGTVVDGLAELLLGAESETLAPDRQMGALDLVSHQLTDQLDQFSLGTDRTLTLTARTARIPLTILSTASYSLVADLTLSGDKFEFPHGAGRTDVDIDRSTTVVPVQVEARTIGDLPLVVTLRTPTGGLVIARAQITVRSTATSVVGIILTLAAAAVLVVWWARSWRSGRAAKRRARGQPA